MEFTHYSDAADMLNSIGHILIKRELHNNLILGLLYSIKNNIRHYEYKPYMCALYDNKNLIAAALMTPPNNLIIHCEHIDDNALKVIARDLIEKEINVPGVVGISAAAEAFSQTWSFENICTAEIAMNMGVFGLMEINDIKGLPDGKLILADMNDRDTIIHWMKLYEEEALHRESAANLASRIEHMIAREIIYIWKDETENKSMAIRTRKILNGETISGVFTPGEFRRKGYASAVVLHLSQRILDDGNTYVCLFTDLSNPTSNSIYKKIGYKPICKYKEFKFI